MNTNTPPEVVRNIATQFGIEVENKELTTLEPNFTLDEIISVLSQRILELLEKDHGKLFSILYRIDVKEELVKEALSANFTDDAARRLAELIVQRQIQKYNYRTTGKM